MSPSPEDKLGTKLAHPMSHLPRPSFPMPPDVAKGHAEYQPVPSHVPYPPSWPGDILGTRLSHPMSHIPIPFYLSWPRDTLGTNLSHPTSHAPVPFSLSWPRDISGTNLSHPTSHFPVLPAGQGTQWVPTCPIPRPSSLPPQLARRHRVPNCPIPHPSAHSPQLAKGHSVYQIVPASPPTLHLPSSIKAPLFSPDKA